VSVEEEAVEVEDAGVGGDAFAAYIADGGAHQ